MDEINVGEWFHANYPSFPRRKEGDLSLLNFSNLTCIPANSCICSLWLFPFILDLNTYRYHTFFMSDMCAKFDKDKLSRLICFFSQGLSKTLLLYRYLLCLPDPAKQYPPHTFHCRLCQLMCPPLVIIYFSTKDIREPLEMLEVVLTWRCLKFDHTICNGFYFHGLEILWYPHFRQVTKGYSGRHFFWTWIILFV